MNGWIKMKSYHPGSTTLSNPPDVDSGNPQEEEEEEDEDQKVKVKFKPQNFLQNNQKCHITNEKVSLKDVSFKTLQDSILA
jgi:hypothetical protein